MDTKGKEIPAAGGLNWRNKPRRRFSAAERLAMVLECETPGVSVAQVAQRNRVNSNLLFKWKKKHECGLLAAPSVTAALVPVRVVKKRGRPSKLAARTRARAATPAGAIEIEMAGARIILHGTVSEANLGAVLRALARK